VRLDAPFTLDIAEFETALAQVAAVQEAGDYAEVMNALAVAVGMYTGELLPDCYDDWILPCASSTIKLTATHSSGWFCCWKNTASMATPSYMPAFAEP